MSLCLRCALVSVMFLLLYMPTPMGEAAEVTTDFKVGVATADVTPPLPYSMAGYYSKRLSTGTHDPLLVKVLVFEQKGQYAALVVFDLISMQGSVTREFRKRAQNASGIPEAKIMVTSTHTHTGPIRRNWNPKATKEANQKALEQGDDDQFNYELYIVEKAVDAIVAAKKNLRSARMSVGQVKVDFLSFNRRFHMKSGGEVVFNPGIKNPNIDRPAGPIDPDVKLLLLSDPKTGKPFASLTSFACHLDTTGGVLFSADYPYYLSNVLQEKYGKEFISVFATGTCGDINHIDVSGKTRRRAPEIGTELGQCVAKAHDNNMKVELPHLASLESIITWQRKVVTEEEVQKAKKMKEAIYDPKVGKYTFLERVRAGMVLNLATMPAELKLDVQVLRLSKDTAIVTMPGEIFVELGLALKKASPFPNTFVLELAQDNIIYVPTKKAFKEGSYETINSQIQPGGGEKMVETALDLLNKLRD